MEPETENASRIWVKPDYPRLLQLWGEDKLAAMQQVCKPETMHIFELVPSEAELTKLGWIIRGTKDSMESERCAENTHHSDKELRDIWNYDVAELNYGDVIRGVHSLHALVSYGRLHRSGTRLEISNYTRHLPEGITPDTASSFLCDTLHTIFYGMPGRIRSGERNNLALLSDLTSKHAITYDDGSEVMITGHKDGKVELLVNAPQGQNELAIVRMEKALNILRQLGICYAGTQTQRLR